MRMLMEVSIPNEPFNTLVRKGTAGSTLAKILDSLKPEAVYFTEMHGHRGAMIVVDLADPSKIPALAEPWFLSFNAEVRYRVVMIPEDLKKSGLDEIGKKWAK